MAQVLFLLILASDLDKLCNFSVVPLVKFGPTT